MTLRVEKSINRLILEALGWRVAMLGFQDGRRPRPALFAPPDHPSAPPAQWFDDEKMESMRWDADITTERLWTGLEEMPQFQFDERMDHIITICMERRYPLLLASDGVSIVSDREYIELCRDDEPVTETAARALLAALTKGRMKS